MASLTHETQPRTGYRLRAYAAGDSSRRFSIWLGEIPSREAETIKRHIEAVLDSQKLGTPMPGETQRWLGRIPELLRRKLIPVLGTARNVREAVDQYIVWATRTHKPSTVETMTCTLNQFASEFGRVQMRSLAAVEVDQWLSTRNVRANTRAKHAKHLKTWIFWCRKAGFVDDLQLNTAAYIKAGNKEFITREKFDRLMIAFTDAEDRCALALARWLGIRMPSELAIRTADIDFDDRTITVIDSKRTHRCNRGPPITRKCPLFRELVPYLDAVWRPSEKYLLPTLVGTSFTARVRVARDKLGLTWPRLFHSLRATRQTELIAEFGMHAACEWIGNSPKIAQEFYELIDDETWARAKAD